MLHSLSDIMFPTWCCYLTGQLSAAFSWQAFFTTKLCSLQSPVQCTGLGLLQENISYLLGSSGGLMIKDRINALFLTFNCAGFF